MRFRFLQVMAARWYRPKRTPALFLIALLAYPAVFAAQAPGPVTKADSIIILKRDHVLELISGGKAIKTYKVALGRGGLEPKHREGDGRTPEGKYVIDRRNAASEFHLALHVSYPNGDDRRLAAHLGVRPGGDIMIHGLPNGMEWLGPTHRLKDWTQGCVAVTNVEIEEIWKLVPVGTPVEIRP